MKYQIKEILPGQIKVEFENGSLALVPVGRDFTPEQVDAAVSKYDPDFIPRITEFMSIGVRPGETRTSIPEPEKKKQEAPVAPSVNSEPVKTSLYGGLPLPLFHKDQVIISLLMADYFEKEQGDKSLREALYSRVKSYIEVNGITVDQAISSLDYNDDDAIYRLAEEQLAND